MDPIDLMDWIDLIELVDKIDLLHLIDHIDRIYVGTFAELMGYGKRKGWYGQILGTFVADKFLETLICQI